MLIAERMYKTPELYALRFGLSLSSDIRNISGLLFVEADRKRPDNSNVQHRQNIRQDQEAAPLREQYENKSTRRRLQAHTMESVPEPGKH